MKIPHNLLMQGQEQYTSTMSDPNRGPRDPVITPFVMAMKLGGYEEVLFLRCAKLRACPFCPVGKANYSQLYRKDGKAIWACPHCQNITPN